MSYKIYDFTEKELVLIYRMCVSIGGNPITSARAITDQLHDRISDMDINDKMNQKAKIIIKIKGGLEFEN